MTQPRRLFVESNFLIAVARRERERESNDFDGELIVAAAENNDIELIIPVFSFYEAFAKERRRRNEQAEWVRLLERDAREVIEKQVDPTRGKQLQEAADSLHALSDDFERRLDATSRRIRAVATIQPLGSEDIETALAFRSFLDTGDPWVCASLRRVLGESSAAPVVFLCPDEDFFKQVKGWSKVPQSQSPTETDTLIEPFRSIKVLPRSSSVTQMWSLKSQT